MPALGTEAIKKYYSDTQFEYGLVWNWGSKNTPALHFGYYDEKATNHHRSVIRANDFLEASYFDMPFEDNSADVVWAIESVCHAKDKFQFYKEAFRVLKPGGKLI